MSSVAVVPSYKISDKQYEAAIKNGLRVAQVHGLDTLRFLADTKEREATLEQVAKFVDEHQNDGLILEPVVTRWLTNPSRAAAERNERLMTDVGAVVILGPVSTQSATKFLGYAFGAGLTVVQVDFNLAAEVVTPTSVMCLNESYRPEAKTLQPKSEVASGWGEFTAPAKKRGAK